MGEGVERPKLDTLVEDLKIKDKVIFTGHISKQEQAIGACDIFAISSDTEQMPNSVNEAMAAGLPIVGFAVGDIKHMVSEENKKLTYDIEFTVKLYEDSQLSRCQVARKGSPGIRIARFCSGFSTRHWPGEDQKCKRAFQVPTGSATLLGSLCSKIRKAEIRARGLLGEKHKRLCAMLPQIQACFVITNGQNLKPRGSI